MKKDETLEYIGEITLGNKIVISDPCYSPGMWCQGEYDNVRPGKYKCYATYFYDSDWGTEFRRVANIYIVHESCNVKTDIGIRQRPRKSFTIGIDSGQMGIYDSEYYKDHNGDNDEWYEKSVCKGTLDYIKNPHYVPFEESEYYKETDKDVYEHLGEEVFKDFIERRIKYEHSVVSLHRVERTKASVLDGVAVVSATSYGDIDPTLYFTYSKNEIVAIRLQSR